MKKVSLEPSGPFVANWFVFRRGYRWQIGLEPLPERLAIKTTVVGESFRQWMQEPAAPERDFGEWLVFGDPLPENDPRRKEKAFRVYNPLDVPGLHRIFAATQTTEGGILGFAERYGLLGRRTFRLLYSSGNMTKTWGESFFDWSREIERMKTLLILWDRYRSTDPQAFVADKHDWIILGRSQSYEVQGNRARLFFPGCVLSGSNEIDEDEGPELSAEEQAIFGPYEVDVTEVGAIEDPPLRARMAARILIRHAVNEELSRGTDAAIDVKYGVPIVLIPKDLRGALYVHFARELTGTSVPAVACIACGSYFIPVHGRQKYCDDRCKFKGYRQRKKSQSEATDGS